MSILKAAIADLSSNGLKVNQVPCGKKGQRFLFSTKIPYIEYELLNELPVIPVLISQKIGIKQK